MMCWCSCSTLQLDTPHPVTFAARCSDEYRAAAAAAATPHHTAACTLHHSHPPTLTLAHTQQPSYNERCFLFVSCTPPCCSNSAPALTVALSASLLPPSLPSMSGASTPYDEEKDEGSPSAHAPHVFIPTAVIRTHAVTDHLSPLTSSVHQLKYPSPSMAASSLGEGAAAPQGPPTAPPSPAPSSSLLPYHLAYLHSWPLMGSTSPLSPPAPIPHLDFDAERDLLLQSLSSSCRSLRLFISHATTQQLLRVMTVGCRALHYSGHGMAGGCLAFESDGGDMHAVDVQALHQMMTAGRRRDEAEPAVQLVFVSACHSESTADAFIQAGVRHVIAVRADQQVHDVAAKTFMSIFYYSLFRGRTVRESYEKAKVSVMAGVMSGGGGVGGLEDKKFLLLPEDGEHDVVIFGGDVMDGSWVNVSEEETHHNLSALPQAFLGRNPEMQQIVDNLVRKKRRLMTLIGSVGVGKSALAIAAATYMCKRHAFDGVYLVDVTQLVKRPSATLATLCSEAMGLPSIINSNALFCAHIKNEKLLFVFDEAELAYPYEPTSQRNLATFLTQLLSLSSSRALLTALDPLPPLPHIQQHLLAVPPLSPNNAVKLFFAMRPRDLPYSEFGCHSTDAREAARVLGRHEVVRLMEGVPRRIWRVVAMLGEGGMRMDQPRLLESVRSMIAEEKEEEWKRRARYKPPPPPEREDEERLLDAINRNSQKLSSRPTSAANGTSTSSPSSAVSSLSPPPHHTTLASIPPSLSPPRFSEDAASFWRDHAHNETSVPYQLLERPLQTHFVAFCHTPQRPLSADDMLVIRRKLEVSCETDSPGCAGGRVTMGAFNHFWQWFSALEWTVMRCRSIWNDMQPAGSGGPAGLERGSAAPTSYSPALHSFLTREQSASLLRSMSGAPHPFLLRLSESQSHCLTVCWLQRQHQVTYTLIHVQRDDEGGGFSIELDGGGRQRYATLSELVMKYAAFETVLLCRPTDSTHYPTAHKTQIFATDII